MAAHRDSSSLVRTLVRIVVALGGAALLFTGVVGLLHLPGAKPLLLTLLGRCPVGFDASMTADARDAARETVLAPVRGDVPALSRPALGFALDSTSRADVAAWSVTHHVACTDDKTQLRCADAPAAALGGLRAHDHVTFSFDARDHLIAVDATSDLTAERAVELQQAAVAEVTAAAGPATTTLGQPDVAFLEGAHLRMSSAEFRFTDYRAKAYALNHGQGRFAFRETYQSLVKPVASAP